MSVRKQGAGLALPVLLLLLLGATATAADVIFRVPDVMVRHAAAARPVGTVPRSAFPGPVAAATGLEKGEDELLLDFEEYFVEHEVSTADARKAARLLDLDSIPLTRPGCGVCSARAKAYCEWRVVADHCCCERAQPEPMPFLPHTCYVGAARCKPLAHDCAAYKRLRDCCCDRIVAERWKAVLSSSPTLHRGSSFICVTLLVVIKLTGAL